MSRRTVFSHASINRAFLVVKWAQLLRDIESRPHYLVHNFPVNREHVQRYPVLFTAD